MADVKREGKPQYAQKKEFAQRDFLPARISEFDTLVSSGGFERGSTILVLGGFGTGKTTFAVQSLYYSLLAGEKCVYLTFEEAPEKLLKHMYTNYGWDLKSFQEEGKFAIAPMDPFMIARNVEALLLQKEGKLMINVEGFNLPFSPDRLVVDSLSALEIAFKGNMQNYRVYVKHLFDRLDAFNSVNFVIAETELGAGAYTHGGIEEFLADGVIVLYNFMSKNTRERALEILKLRSSDHTKKLIPFRITKKGIEIDAHKPIEKIMLDANAVAR